MSNFVRGAEPIWLFRDLVGLPLNDEYWVSFLSNTFPYIPSLVYMSPNVIKPDTTPTPWPDPIQLLANGTLPDNIYFQSDLVYRIEVRHGPLQSDQLVYVINDYVPAGGGGGSSSSSSTNTENIISNGQFSNVSFGFDTTTSSTIPTLNITAAGIYQIAPGWSLILTGAGTAKVQQIISFGNASTDANPLIPPYYLEINLNGWTTAVLSQRFYGNGALWAGEWLYMSMVGQSKNGAPEKITFNYVTSENVTIPIGTGDFPPDKFQLINGIVNLPASTNTQLNNVAYVDIQIVLPNSSITDIGNIYLAARFSSTTLSVNDFSTPPDETIERQTDHLFHYYAESAVSEPKDSLLTGWVFPLNPYQFITRAITTATVKTSYIADQTILHQETANQLQTGQSTIPADRSGLIVKAVDAAATTRFALIQYIDASTIQPYWSYVVSSLVRARLKTTHSSNVRIKMRLLYRTIAVPDLGDNEPIASWAAGPDGHDPVFSADWHEIKPLNDPAYFLSTTQDPENGAGSFPSYSFDSFLLPDQETSIQMLAVVIYTLDNLNSTAGSTDSVVFDKISLVPNQFGVDANPITFDEGLRQCQFYYEKSYDLKDLPGTVTVNGQILEHATLLKLGAAASWNFYPASFYLYYKQQKRSPATLRFYSPTSATPNNVFADILRNGVNATFSGTGIIESFSTNWRLVGGSIAGETVISITTATPMFGSTDPGFNGDEGVITFQYEADARLGVVP